VVFNVYLQDQIQQFESHFISWLIGFDIVMLVLAALASYFLSGRTLAPIERSLADQERFAADASHELRTPLSNMTMEIEAHQRTHQLDADTAELLQSVQGEINRMRDMVAGLLSLVHADQPHRLDHLNLSQTITQVIDLMQPRLTDHNLQLDTQLDLQLQIKGQADEVKQILMILLDNAIKYTPRQGHIKITTRLIENEAQLFVFNSGPGINQADLPRVFDRFYRGGNAQLEGSGLGLAIARSLVEKMHGTIAIASEVGHGVTLRLTWPLATS
jgi:signal transduction histidine kinase